MRRFVFLVPWALAALLWLGCSHAPPKPVTAETPHPAKPVKLVTAHLPNAYQLTEKVISGGLPEGEAGFDELARLGVKTVISVDGATPDVAAARKAGLAYVHLPHGYDGIAPERMQELAKAVRDLPGPIYIHCHHGKHRSPAAAAVACVGAGLIGPADAVPFLKMAGTSDKYRGLYQSAESARPFDAKLLDALAVEFRETSPIEPMAAAMVQIERLHDRLGSAAKSAWPAGDKQTDAAYTALLLKEQFIELARTKTVQDEPERFRELVRASEAEATTLETLLSQPAAADIDRAPFTQALERITANCAACHKEFRDKPLSEKKR